MEKKEVVGSVTSTQNPEALILFFDDGTVGEVSLLEVKQLLKGKRKTVSIRDHILEDYELENL